MDLNMYLSLSWFSPCPTKLGLCKTLVLDCCEHTLVFDSHFLLVYPYTSQHTQFMLLLASVLPPKVFHKEYTEVSPSFWNSSKYYPYFDLIFKYRWLGYKSWVWRFSFPWNTEYIIVIFYNSLYPFMMPFNINLIYSLPICSLAESILLSNPSIELFLLWCFSHWNSQQPLLYKCVFPLHAPIASLIS